MGISWARMLARRFKKIFVGGKYFLIAVLCVGGEGDGTWAFHGQGC